MGGRLGRGPADRSSAPRRRGVTGKAKAPSAATHLAFRAQKYCVLVISGYTSVCSATGRGGNPRQNILRLDDPDESENTETVRFDVDGQGYEIDLAEADRQRFTSPRGVYLRQPVGRSRSRSLVAGGRRAECGASRQSDITQTREWAIGRNKDAAGVPVQERSTPTTRLTDNELSVNCHHRREQSRNPPFRTTRPI